jgi:hypothetical protein
MTSIRTLLGGHGATPSRDTQAAPHPMRTRRTVLSSLRSSNPAIRASAKTAAVALGVLPAPTPRPVGWRRPKPHRRIVPFATGTRRTREG